MQTRGAGRRGATQPRLLVIVVVLGAALAACSGGGTADGASGDVLPAVELPRLGGGGVITRTDLLGTPTVINFWASWCPPCVEEMPAFQEVHRQLGDRVQFLGVDREDVPEQALRLAEETGVTYPLVVDPDASYFRALDGRGMPTTLLVDAEGQVVGRTVGPLTADQLRDRIRRQLGVEVPSD